MSAVERVEAALEAHGCRRGSATATGRMWTCPCHADSTPSLHVSVGDNGRVLLHDHAGCSADDVVATVGLDWSDAFTDAPRNGNGPMREAAVYRYTDEQGTHLYDVVRFDTPEGKTFRQRAADGSWGLRGKDISVVPYRLREVVVECQRGGQVYVVEGEKDADRLVAEGRVATCNPGGAGKWPYDFGEHLRGARMVTIVADRDDVGVAHAREVAASLAGRGIAHRVVTAAVERPKADVSDHLDGGHALDELVPLAEEPVEGDEDRHEHAAASPFIEWGEFLTKDRTASDWVIDGVLARGRGHAIYAKHKTGKSLVMMWIALELIRAEHVVVYLDYEQGEEDVYERLEDMGWSEEADNLERLRYALLPSLPPLDTADGGRALHALVDGVQAEHPGRHVVVIIDTIGRAVAGDENDADTIRDFYRHAGLGLKQRGMTWARLDHAGKDIGKGQRGTSAKGDDVDVVWQLAVIEGGLELRRDAARMGWVPERVPLRMAHDPLRFVPSPASWPAGTLDCAAALDRLGVPLDASIRDAQSRLKQADDGRRQAIVRAALRHRRDRAQTPPEGRDTPPDTPDAETSGYTPGYTAPKPHSCAADTPPDTPGYTPAGHTGIHPHPPKGCGVPEPLFAEPSRDVPRWLGDPDEGVL